MFEFDAERMHDLSRIQARSPRKGEEFVLIMRDPHVIVLAMVGEKTSRKPAQVMVDMEMWTGHK